MLATKVKQWFNCPCVSEVVSLVTFGIQLLQVQDIFVAKCVSYMHWSQYCFCVMCCLLSARMQWMANRVTGLIVSK